MYRPKPIDTSQVELPESILPLVDSLAEHLHELWARQRMTEGWTPGPQQLGGTKEHPHLVPFGQLPDSEKAFDRNSAVETLKALIALGYRIEKQSR